ncbi:hypothetical protein G7Y89_g2726 [Cudoniella acicularis]|uniref:Uncharacterized protein n=1 Tax=Cudoniella acicularis TaxID=354080 RepID=A0A8H4RUV8_9HELO|nr:hypothetical protein G7Y89_g2726 [Cudoniella acicularis]
MEALSNTQITITAISQCTSPYPTITTGHQNPAVGDSLVPHRSLISSSMSPTPSPSFTGPSESSRCPTNASATSRAQTAQYSPESVQYDNTSGLGGDEPSGYGQFGFIKPKDSRVAQEFDELDFGNSSHMSCEKVEGYIKCRLQDERPVGYVPDILVRKIARIKD